MRFVWTTRDDATDKPWRHGFTDTGHVISRSHHLSTWERSAPAAVLLLPSATIAVSPPLSARAVHSALLTTRSAVVRFLCVARSAPQCAHTQGICWTCRKRLRRRRHEHCDVAVDVRSERVCVSHLGQCASIGVFVPRCHTVRAFVPLYSSRLWTPSSNRRYFIRSALCSEPLPLSSRSMVHRFDNRSVSPCFHRFQPDLGFTISSSCHARETDQIWSYGCPSGHTTIGKRSHFYISISW